MVRISDLCRLQFKVESLLQVEIKNKILMFSVLADVSFEVQDNDKFGLPDTLLLKMKDLKIVPKNHQINKLANFMQNVLIKQINSDQISLIKK